MECKFQFNALIDLLRKYLPPGGRWHGAAVTDEERRDLKVGKRPDK